jgi:hypothetical protein
MKYEVIYNFIGMYLYFFLDKRRYIMRTSPLDYASEGKQVLRAVEKAELVLLHEGKDKWRRRSEALKNLENDITTDTIEVNNE